MTTFDPFAGSIISVSVGVIGDGTVTRPDPAETIPEAIQVEIASAPAVLWPDLPDLPTDPVAEASPSPGPSGEAIRTALAQADPVGLSDIATRLGVKPGTAHQWAQRGLLPAPRWTVSGAEVYEWSDIAAWAKTRRGPGRPKRS